MRPRLLAVLLLGLLLARGAAAGPARSEGFARITRDAQGRPLALETSITRYTSARGYTVDLVSVLHIGEGAYYRQLNKDLKAYDAVLYEMVVPENPQARQQRAEGTGPGPEALGDSGGSLLSALQIRLADLLGLEFQLARLQYRAPNFVHADLTVQEFQSSMRRQGESVEGILMKLLQASFENSSTLDDPDLEDLDLLRLLAQGPTQKERYALRRALASGVGQMDRLMMEMSGPRGSTLITVRNQKVLSVLEEQLRQGKKRLAILYGAGHMPDLERRLFRDLKLQRGQRRWLVAWNLQPPGR
jgi:hypothetical protein